MAIIKTYDEFKLQGLEAYSEFRYYKGEKKNPYNNDEYEAQHRWWNFEKDYFDYYMKSEKWKNFMDFFTHWIKEKAAPEIGYDIEKGNKWLDEYEAYSPYK